MLAFTVGGATGLINASFTVNLVVHNTAYIPGHLHLTVGTAVALSFMGISYWLVPHLTGRRLFSDGMAVLQAWLYFAGVLLMSRGLMGAGLEGQPRRVPANSIPYRQEGWSTFDALTGLGGVLMVISATLFFWNIIATVRNREPAQGEELTFSLSETIHGADVAPPALDRLGVWVLAAVALVLVAYLPALVTQGIDLSSPGFSLF